MTFVAVAAIVLFMFSMANADQPAIKLGMLLLVSQSLLSLPLNYLFIFSFYTVQGEDYSNMNYHQHMDHILVVEDITQNHEESDKLMHNSSLCLKYCTIVL